MAESKDNQTITICQSIKYNKSKIFLIKSCRKCSRKTILRPLSKKSKSLDQYLKVLYSSHLLDSKFRAIETYCN